MSKTQKSSASSPDERLLLACNLETQSTFANTYSCGAPHFSCGVTPQPSSSREGPVGKGTKANLTNRNSKKKDITVSDLQMETAVKKHHGNTLYQIISQKHTRTQSLLSSITWNERATTSFSAKSLLHAAVCSRSIQVTAVFSKQETWIQSRPLAGSLFYSSYSLSFSAQTQRRRTSRAQRFRCPSWRLLAN